jgi:mRNA-degrading endonuclease RelE of RelBE toxin-antitoxin system
MYTVVFSEEARKDLRELQKKAPQAVPKLAKLIDELREHTSKQERYYEYSCCI